MSRLVLLIALIAQTTSPSAPTTQPATAPTTQAATQPTTQPISLLKGQVVLSPPPDDRWKEVRRDEAANLIEYQSGERALMLVTVMPADIAITKDVIKKLSDHVSQRLIKNAEEKNLKLVQPPTIEQDPKFVLRIRVRCIAEGSEVNQLLLYREVGGNLVHTMITVQVDPQNDVVKSLQADAEKMVLQAKSGEQVARERAATRPAAGKPFTIAEAKLRLTPPGGWDVETKEAAQGIVATLRDPDDRTNLIAVSVRPLPPEARRDAKLRDIIVDEIVNGESQQFVIEGATLQGNAEAVKDTRFLRKTRAKYETKDIRFQITSRQKRVGDAIMSVTCVCLEDMAQIVDKLADDVAIKATAVGR